MFKIWTASNKELWKGRVDRDLSSLRYHQVVQCERIDALFKHEGSQAFGFIGFASDEGVRRNKGRVGASEAPNAIRQRLATLPYHHSTCPMIDVGNIVCTDRKLEQAQKTLGKGVHQLLSKNYIPIIVGGGHETLYGHYLGVREYIGDERSLGIINIDAHFDLRDDETPSSGTMFHQILHHDANVGYLCLGIQELGNTKALFDEAEKVGCTYMYAEDVLKDEKTYEVIDTFANNHDVLLLTLCSDAISSSVAPGVSAASPYGLSAPDVRTLIQYIISKEQTISFDLSEVNPLVDEHNKTVQLGSLLLADGIRSFARKSDLPGEKGGK